jgi:excinuclease ABC subunit C
MAVEAMKEMRVGSIPVASIAKENEEIFIPQKAEPVILPHSSPGLQLLQAPQRRVPPFRSGIPSKSTQEANLYLNP